MAKSDNSEKQPESIKKNRTWEKIKTVGITAGTFVVGAAVVIGIAAIVVVSGGSALYLGGGIPGRSGNWGSSPSSKNNKPKNPSLYKNEEERGRLKQAAPSMSRNNALLLSTSPKTALLANTSHAGSVGKSAYDSPVNQPKKEKNNPVNMDVRSDLWHKIKTNPWKTLGTALLATAFPAGTIIAGAIVAGVVGKSAYDSHVNHKPEKAKNTPVGGVGSDLLHKIKTKPLENIRYSATSYCISCRNYYCRSYRCWSCRKKCL